MALARCMGALIRGPGADPALTLQFLLEQLARAAPHQQLATGRLDAWKPIPAGR